MPQYNTKQRLTLFSYFEKNSDKAFTARQIVDALGSKVISVSAVYRNLSAMEVAGTIKRTNNSGSREALYQYLNAEGCKGCLHLSCKRCGRILHLNSEITEQLSLKISESGQFSIDKSDTIIYGICESCQ